MQREGLHVKRPRFEQQKEELEALPYVVTKCIPIGSMTVCVGIARTKNKLDTKSLIKVQSRLYDPRNQSPDHIEEVRTRSRHTCDCGFRLPFIIITISITQVISITYLQRATDRLNTHSHGITHGITK